jgi:hypothetical protein
MKEQYSLTVWEPPKQDIVPAKVTDPALIAGYAKQLSKREQTQVAQAFQAGNYEMAINFVWSKSMAALKKELATLGMQFLGEMLGKPDLSDDDDPAGSITEKEAVRLAEELGVVSSTEAMRLRHTQEMVAHFSSLDASVIDSEGIELDQLEAIRSLKTCVGNILGKPKIEVATKFAEFRKALESETFEKDDHRVSMLISSPYFFRKLTVTVLLSVIKAEIGAKVENALANLNTILPLVWSNLRDTEKWQVGHAYAEVFAAGKTTATSGIKQALLKVKGFDFVPENLRSDTFVKAAEAMIRAHEGMNNFYNEPAPTRALLNLGSTIPTPAFAACASATIAIRLGNSYGVSWEAVSIADEILDRFTEDRWRYYLNQCLAGDMRILNKLAFSKPRENWAGIVRKYDLKLIEIKDRWVAQLVAAALLKTETKLEAARIALHKKYYGNE